MPPRPAIRRRLLMLAAPFAGWIALSTLLGVLTVGSSIGLMAAAAWIISMAALRPSIAVLQVAIVGVRFFGISRGLFRYLERLASHQTTFGLLAEIRVWFYRALEPLAPARLGRFRSGDLLSRLVADVDALEDFYVRALAPPLVALLVSGLLLIFMATFAPVIAGVLLVFLLMAGLGAPLLTLRLGRDPGRALAEARGDLYAALVDGVQGLADVLACGAGDRQAGRLAALNARVIAQQRRLAGVDGLQSGLAVVLVGWAAAAVLAAAIPRVHGVDLASLTLATVAGFEAVLPLAAAFQAMAGSLASAGRLVEMVEGVAPAVVDPVEPAPPPADALPLAVDGLSFRYPSDGAAPAPLVLDAVSFAVEAGRMTAVVGPSGAGKSTLAGLLLRFWDYERGRITLGGVEVRSLPADDVRACFAVVTQRVHLFNTTVRENLLMARPDAAQAQVEAAARAARAHDFIAGLPEGYETFVGEAGVALSGGERQRLALARALLKDAPILLLDEPAANLDAVTAAALMDTLAGLRAGRAMLIITHRLAGLDAADDILVLDQGRVVERGRHGELLAAGGLYARLWLAQGELFAGET